MTGPAGYAVPGPRRWAARGVRVLVLAGLLAVLPASAAWAHADLLESVPADQAVMAAAPTQVVLRFSEPVSTALGSVKVLAADGSRVDTGTAGTPDGGSTVLRPLRADLPAGTYTVLWRVLSDDSHSLNGALTFRVGPPAPAGVAGPAPPAAAADAAQTGGRAVPALLALGRALVLGGLVLLVGGVGFLLGLWPAGRTVPAARRTVWTGWGLAVAGSAAGLLLQGPYAAGLGLRHTLDAGLLAAVLGSRFGLAAVLRLALLALSAGLLLRLGRSRLPVLAATGGLLGTGLLLSTSAVGHSGSGDLAALALPADALHLAAAAGWVGGLVMLAVAALRQHPADVADLLPRWSRVAATTTAVLVATGAFAAWRQVRDLPALPATAYGRLLLVKLALVAVMFALGAIARSWVRQRQAVPRAPTAGPAAPAPADPWGAPGAVLLLTRDPVEVGTAGPSTQQDDAPAAADLLRRLRRNVLAEAGLAALVLVVTAVLVQTAPARSAWSPVFRQSAALSPALRLSITVAPARAGLSDLRLVYSDPAGAAVDVPAVTARWSRPGRPGVVPVALTRTGTGTHGGPRVVLPEAGTWQLEVVTRTSDLQSATTRFSVQIG